MRRPAVYAFASMLPEPENIESVLSLLERDYPDARSWFTTKVVPGLIEGSRRVFGRSRNGTLKGIAIAKRHRLERKLCTLWVAPDVRGTGLGGTLMDEALRWLEDPRPLFTVSEDRVGDLLPLIRRHGFLHVETIASRYVNGRPEAVFNGRLRT